MKKYNFGAGPCILPQEVIEQTAQGVLNLNNIGLSILEISHRSADFQVIIDEAMALLKEILNIPEGYSILFLGGGASSQFAMVPYNFLNKKAGYLDTGVWASKAYESAKVYGDAQVVASSKDTNYTYIPTDYTIPQDLDYFHITTNNTIYGTEINDAKLNEIYKKVGKVPLISDMSSDILSRPIDVSKYDLIYGGAQKNLAPAGVTLIIIKDEFLNKITRELPPMFDYRIHVKNESMYNTPPVLPIYTAMLNLRWLKKNGGIAWIDKRNQEKADLLYGCLDNSKIFRSVAEKEDRSRMNISFVLKDEYQNWQDDFFEFAKQRGMVGLKGHRKVGGFRASCYNAMDVEGVKALVDCIHAYEELKLNK